MRLKLIYGFILFTLFFNNHSFGQLAGKGPAVLVVMAHPDDETTFAATLYKICKEQHGSVDLFTITIGEGGYKYSTLAENYYGLSLTDEHIGRKSLPQIRKKELKNAGQILGVHQYYFLDQKDAHYTTNEHEPLDTSWNVALVEQRLKKVVTQKHYDFVFCLLPEASANGQHKAATIVALNVLAQVPDSERPVILGAVVRSKTTPSINFNQYEGYAVTQTLTEAPTFSVDRTSPFSYNGRLNYKVVVNWEIAEHKSQGVMQMAMNDGDLEEFWYFALNGENKLQRSRILFDKIRQVPYLTRTY